MILLAMALSLVAQDKLSIQVLSTEDNSSITAEFLQKIEKMQLPYQIRQGEGRYRVLVGEFDDYDTAVQCLEDVKQKVTSKAFVVTMPEKKEVNIPEQQMQKVMVMAKARTLEKMQEQEVSEEQMEPMEPVQVARNESPSPEQNMISKHEPKKVVGMQEDVKTEEIFCKSSKKALRESEISEALSYYKNSSFYQFRN